MLLLANLLVVAWSVQKVGWVETPTLAVTVVLAVTAGLLLSKLSLPAYLLIPVGLALGLGLIVWQLVDFQPERSGLANVGELWDRLDLWLDSARAGTISLDPIPFAFLLLVSSWLLGFLCAWSLFRYHNILGVMALAGFALAVNLTNAPSEALIDSVLFVFTALILLTRVQSVQKQNHWRDRGIVEDGDMGTSYMTAGLWFAGIILLVGYLLPQYQSYRPLNGMYNYITSPVDNLSSDFNRLFAGIPGKKPRSYREFNNVLPLRGTISNSENPVLEVRSPYPLYLKVRSYSVYTSKGWIMGDSEFQAPDWTPSFFLEQDNYLSTGEIQQQVTSIVENKHLFTGGQVVNAPRAVLKETYNSPTYELDIRNSSWPELLPPRQEHIADLVREASRFSGRAQPTAFLQDSLPAEWMIKEVKWQGGTPRVFVLQLAVPGPPEVLYLHSGDRKIKKGETYNVETSISFAGEEQLREAGEEYPTWVYARYLQLPNKLPQRVRDLANELATAAPAMTPYDKAKAIEAHLKTFPYTQEIDPPPFDKDGVDYFLFDLGMGYSEYFASAMTVLLRAADVPSRLVTGYTQGEQVSPGVQLIRDNDTHAWTEVFFPGYGWIAFEPTPGKSVPRIVPLAPPPAVPREGGDFFFDDELEEDEDLLGLGSGEVLINPTEEQSNTRLWFLFLLLVPVGVYFLGRILWRRFMMPSPNPEVIFRRLVLMTTLGGLGPQSMQTPYQYRDALAQRFPINRLELHEIVGAYVRNFYGRKDLTEREQAELGGAWERIRGALLVRIIRRR